jgi:hypothetical protein
MASLRLLKKDIDYLMSLVLEECMYVIENHPEAGKEKVLELARKVIATHRELRLRINHPDGKDNPKIMKAYLKKVIDDLYKSADAALDELAELIR